MAQDRSNYYFNLDSNAKSRYEEKLVAIDLCIDQFLYKKMNLSLVKTLPNGQMFHMLTFLRI